MVIDDDEALLEVLRLRLGEAGFEVIAINHPTEAMSRVLTERPDLIILDIEMPYFNGLDFQECLYSTERGQQIPIIYLSGADNFPNFEDSMKLGAEAFISKPYDLAELLETIDQVLARRGVRRPANSKLASG